MGWPRLTQLEQHIQYPRAYSLYASLSSRVICPAVLYFDRKPAAKVIHHHRLELASSVCADGGGHPECQARSERATPCAFFEGRGYFNRNRDALSTTNSKYSLPASDVLGILCKITSNTSHGSRYLAGDTTRRWLHDRFLRRHPRHKTYSFASLHIPGQWKWSRSSDSVLLTPGCPCWQWTKASKSATERRDTAGTIVRLSKIPRVSSSYQTKP